MVAGDQLIAVALGVADNDWRTPLAIEKVAYRIDEFCEAFGVGRTKVFDEIKDGRLKVRKAGRMTLIRAEDAKAWLDALPEK